MRLAPIDWAIVALFLAGSLAVGVWASRRASRDAESYFLSGRRMPWWLLGFSMVATTFSTDTPNLVTDIVRRGGVAGNWSWWAFLLTGMLTVFVYAALWRRTGVTTDVEFYELRYGGRPGALLRGFRALYLGVLVNVLIMASVHLAAIKIGGVMLGLGPVATLLVAGVVTVLFTSLGGLLGVLVTDFVLFIAALSGAVVAAVVALRHPDVGGLHGLLSHASVRDRLSFFPEPGSPEMITLLVVPLGVQWWSTWYPGSEPGGGGYIAQRMLAAKNEKHAVLATLFFNVAHYALRPWPWILVALASVVVYPDTAALARAFPGVDPSVVRDDMAYPAMLTLLGPGALGFVVASLVAAYMSTISTHLNWGASYVVKDFYERFVRKDAPAREQVFVGRVATVLMLVLSALVALSLHSALDAFKLLLHVGAGTGLLFILRWFWWRINAYSELAAMVASACVALWLRVAPPAGLPEWATLVLGVGVTTVAWVGVTLVTPPSTDDTLSAFYRKARPGGPGWARVRTSLAARGQAEPEPAWPVPLGLTRAAVAVMSVYCALFTIGSALYGRWALAGGLALACAVGALVLRRLRVV
jgi:solute:Na+ symporter, SSS family